MSKVNITFTGEETKTIAVGPGKLVAIMDATDVLSSSGKMRLLGCSNGNQATDTEYAGQTVYANVNIGIYKDAKK